MDTILIVEDDGLLGRELNEAFIEAGYTTFWAKTGTTAFETIQSQSISLIFLDIMLPGDKDGYAILAELKKNDEWKRIPVVMLSNLGQLSEIQKAMDMGADDYVVKATVDLDELVNLTKTKYLKH